MRDGRLGPILRLIFALAGVTGVTVVFVRSLHSSHLAGFPSAWATGLAATCMVANTVLSAFAWAALFERRHALDLVRGYFFSLLGKYVPGAIWQAVGQVSAARRSGMSLAEASVAFPMQVLGQLAAAGTLGSIFALEAVHAEPWLRVLCGLGLLSVAPLVRCSWIPRTLSLFGRIARRPIAIEAIPTPRRVLASYGWSIAGLAMASVAFALLLRAMAETPPHFLLAASAFAAAWGIGLLAIPVPAGLGIREGVLVLMLGSAIGSGPLIAASAIVRLVTVVAEIAVLGVTAATLRRGSGPSPANTDAST